MEYRNEIGQTITDEQLDKMLEDIENENYDEFEAASELKFRRIEPRRVSRSTISVQFPTAMKNELSKIAKKNSCSISELIRAYTYDGLEKEKKELA